MQRDRDRNEGNEVGKAPQARNFCERNTLTHAFNQHFDNKKYCQHVDKGCLLYTSDAADDLLCVDLGGRRIIKKKTKAHNALLEIIKKVNNHDINSLS